MQSLYSAVALMTVSCSAIEIGMINPFTVNERGELQRLDMVNPYYQAPVRTTFTDSDPFYIRPKGELPVREPYMLGATYQQYPIVEDVAVEIMPTMVRAVP